MDWRDSGMNNSFNKYAKILRSSPLLLVAVIILVLVSLWAFAYCIAATMMIVTWLTTGTLSKALVPLSIASLALLAPLTFSLVVILRERNL